MTDKDDYLPLCGVDWANEYPDLIEKLRKCQKEINGVLPNRSTVVWNLNHLAMHNPEVASVKKLAGMVIDRYRKIAGLPSPVIPEQVSVDTLIEALAEVTGCDIEDLNAPYRASFNKPVVNVDIAPGEPDEIGGTFWLDLLISRARLKLADHEDFFPDNLDAPVPTEDPEDSNPEKEDSSVEKVVLRAGDSFTMTRTIWRVVPADSHHPEEPSYVVTFAEEDTPDIITESLSSASLKFQTLMQIDHKVKGQRITFTANTGGGMFSCHFE